MAADKAGLAVSKKGLTLKELLQQTSHYSAKVRKGIFIGFGKVVCRLRVLTVSTEIRLIDLGE